MEQRVGTIGNSQTLYVPVEIQGQRYEGLWDTGSGICIATKAVAEAIKADIVPLLTKAVSVTGHTLNLVGLTTLDILFAGKQFKQQFAILDDDSADPVLLGTEFMSKLGSYLLDLDKGVLKTRTEDGLSLVTVRLTHSSQ